MIIFRFSVLVLAVLTGAAAASSKTTVDANLRIAAKAALGGLEVRQPNVPGLYETTIIKADRLLELPFGPVLITKVEIDGASHAQSGALGIYYLRREGTRYIVRKKWPDAIDGFGFGYPPDWTVTTRFTQFPAINASAGWMGQGCTSGYSILAELTPSGPAVSDVIFNSYSDAGVGSGKVHEFNGKIVNVSRARSFDVVATGTNWLVEHYVLKRGRFVRIEKESRLEC
jgi:hypothetical protein